MADIGITGIVPFSYTGSTVRTAGSTFLRVDGIVDVAHDFRKYVHGEYYDNLIFQKVYWPEMMEYFTGIKILDLCDPDWLVRDVDIIRIGNLADAITCSSESLTKLVKAYLPRKRVVFIPDRINFAALPTQRGVHKNKAKNIIWFGFVRNAYETIETLLPAIERNGLTLTIVSEKPYQKQDSVLKYKPGFIRYDQSTAYEHIRNADIVINPTSGKKAFYKYKSNNKSIIAWSLGVPVATTNDELDLLMDPMERNKQVQQMTPLVTMEYDIRTSASQFREIIMSIRSSG